MSVLVMTMLLAAIVVAGGVAFAVALARQGQRDHAEQLELLPGVDTGVPAAWAGAHTPEARMHRRLVAAMRSLRAQADAGHEHVDALELRVELEQHAVALDRRLVAAASLPPGTRDRALAELEVSVVAVESAAADLAVAMGSTAASSDVRALEDLTARIRRMRDGGPEGLAEGGTA